MKYTTQQFFANLFKGERITFKAIQEDGKGKNSAPEYGVLDSKFVEYHNSRGHGIFFLPNTTGSKQTHDKDVTCVNAVFIDVDDAELPGYFAITPSAIISREDALGHHVYWFLNPSTDTNSWQAVQEILIGFYDSDVNIKNPARLMRVPGTVNRKEKRNGQKYIIKNLNLNCYDLTDISTAHADKKKVAKSLRLYSNRLMAGMNTETDKGAAHKKMVILVMRMNGLGFSEVDILEELQYVNKKYFKNSYAENTLKEKVSARKYAKGKKGAELLENIEKELARQARVKAAMEPFFYIFAGNFFINYEQPHKERNKEAFNAEFAKDAGLANPASYAFVNNLIKTAEQVLYEPGKGKILTNLDGSKCVNIWRDDRCKPDNTDYAWFVEHLEYLMSAEEVKHFLDWLAYAVQNPGVKIMHAILIIGGFGIGKSIMFNLFKNLFGSSNSKAPQNENLSDVYTKWAKHTCFCLINELKQEGNSNFYNAIKPFITEEEIEIREMYRDAYTIRNTMNLLAFSNEEVPIRLSRGDRRWFVIRSTAKRKTDNYYKIFRKNCDEKAGGVLTFLLEREIPKFNPGMVPNSSEAKEYIINFSRSDFEQWLTEAVELKQPPFVMDIVSVRDVMEELPFEYSRSTYVTSKRVGGLLRGLGAILIPITVRINKVVKRFWIIRNQEKYSNDLESENMTQVIQNMYKSADIFDDVTH